eukprot:m.69766 g.69766  ORF g.69766 m.69766 type:complete len:426 (-) comp16047_c0_seq1:95-1372(-)
MNVREVVRQYLELALYFDIPRTTNDAAACLQQYSELRPEINPFVHNDGTEKMRVTLRGTVPVTIRGNVYHIPIAVHLDHGHPRIAPMCYVEPTPTMEISSHPNVEQSGFIKHECIWRWNESHSSLTNLVSQLCFAFSQRTPVVSRPVQSQTAQYPQSSQNPMTGSPALGMQPQYPVQPHQQHAQPQYPTSSGLQNAQPSPSRPPPPASYERHASSARTGPTGDRGGECGSSDCPPQYTPPDDEPKRIDSDILRMSCLSAATERVQRRLGDLHKRSSGRITESQTRRDGLMRGAAQIQDVKVRISGETTRASDALTWYTNANQRLDGSVRALEEQATGLDSDGTVVPSRVLYGQLMELDAEDNALSDVVYQLQKAVSDPSLNLTNQKSLNHILFTSVNRVCQDHFRVIHLRRKVCDAIAASEEVQT